MQFRLPMRLNLVSLAWAFGGDPGVNSSVPQSRLLHSSVSTNVETLVDETDTENGVW